MGNLCPNVDCKFRKDGCHYPPHITNTEIAKKIVVCKHFGNVVKSELAQFAKG